MNVEFIFFKNSSFEKYKPKKLRSWDSLRPKELSKIRRPFILFSDRNVVDKYSGAIKELNKIDNFKGMVLGVEMPSYNLYSKILETKLSRAVLKKTSPVSIDDKDVVERITHAFKIGAEDDLIADFNVTSEGLFCLLGCNLKMYDGDLRTFPVFQGSSIKKLLSYEIDKFGSYIYWKDLDIHLDITSIKAEIDNEFRQKLNNQKIKKIKEFGSKLKSFRSSKGFSQNQFSGISEKQIRRYEKGEMFPTVKSL